mmetsp:Transcript_29416/g.73925  ORF Transcript_29416/g.73925 Transcript_29416/m.73925 type:complete len:231 (+) Transcript_29416:484-1176(+)
MRGHVCGVPGERVPRAGLPLQRLDDVPLLPRLCGVRHHGALPHRGRQPPGDAAGLRLCGAHRHVRRLPHQLGAAVPQLHRARGVQVVQGHPRHAVRHHPPGAHLQPRRVPRLLTACRGHLHLHRGRQGGHAQLQPHRRGAHQPGANLRRCDLQPGGAPLFPQIWLQPGRGGGLHVHVWVDVLGRRADCDGRGVVRHPALHRVPADHPAHRRLLGDGLPVLLDGAAAHQAL